MLNTPVLFMVFNRPKETSRVLERIMEARPRMLFISADGPRPGVVEDVERCRAVRSLMDDLPQETEVRRLYRQSNLGCKRSVVEALTWFFSEVDQGIVLEDDCLPDPSFFGFCESALLHYTDEERVLIVSGHNPLGAFSNKDDVLLSKYPFIWGWASWSRAWKHYDAEIEGWASEKNQSAIHGWFRSKHSVSFWKKAFRDAAAGTDTWDFQLNYAMCMHKGYAAVSGRNLVANIGFGADALHTRDPEDVRGSLPIFQARAKLKFPERIISHAEFERQVIRRLYFNHDLSLKGKLKGLLRRLRRNVSNK